MGSTATARNGYDVDRWLGDEDPSPVRDCLANPVPVHTTLELV